MGDNAKTDYGYNFEEVVDPTVRRISLARMPLMFKKNTLKGIPVGDTNESIDLDATIRGGTDQDGDIPKPYTKSQISTDEDTEVYATPPSRFMGGAFPSTKGSVKVGMWKRMFSRSMAC